MDRINYGALIKGNKKYPVSYTIKQDGTKVHKKTKLLGSELTEKQAKEALIIHPSFNKTKIAHSYYRLLGKKYDERQAGKQWAQEKNLDRATLELVILSIFAEQKTLLKKSNGK